MLVLNPDEFIEQDEDIGSEHERRKRGVSIFFYHAINLDNLTFC